MHIILTALLGCAMPAALPQDPAQRAQVKALRGDFGHLTQWQEQGYRLILQRGATCDRTAWRTSYYDREPGGMYDAHGKRCTDKTLAANLIPQHSFVFLENNGRGGSQLRVCTDRGARFNDRIARWKGASLWIDTHEHRFCENNFTRIAVLSP